MRRNVRKAVSWIEEFERKATSELDRISKVDNGIDTEVDDLRVKITDLNDNKKILATAKGKIDNLLKAMRGS